jgi:DNA polymerase III sliding clamp (beta) subunit (PCNA family)
MLFTIDSSDLGVAYGLVSKAIPSRAVTEILKTVYLEAQEPDTLILRGTNEIIDITATAKANVNTSGACCIDPIVLDAALKFGGEVRFSLKKRLVVSKGKRRHQAPVVPANQYPAVRQIANWYPLGPGERSRLVDAFERVALAVSSGADKPILQSYFINPIGGFVVTGDGNQIATFDVALGAGLVATPPARQVAAVLSYIRALDDEAEFEVSFGSWSGFRASSWEVQVNSFAGEFPAIARKVTQDAVGGNPQTRLLLDREGFAASLDLCKMYSVKAYASGHSYHVAMSFDGEKAHLKMEIPDLAEIDEPVNVHESEGGPFGDFMFHPALTLEAVSSIKGEQVDFRFFGNQNPFLVLDPDEASLVYLQVAMAPTTSAAPPPPPTKDPEVVGEQETDF